MTRILRIGAFLSAISLLAVGHASADPFNVRPVAPSGTQLQDVFSNIGSSMNAYLDQSNIALFQPQATGGTVQSLFFENPGATFAGSNTFGIYSAADPTKRLQVFSGADSSVTTKTVQFMPGGGVQIQGDSSTTILNFGNTFGFYLQGPGGLFYSEDSLNGGNPQALIYQGKGDNVNLYEANDGVAGCQNTGGIGCLSDLDHWYVAFEDLPYLSADKNFSDLMVLVESITPVPEPATLFLLGAGLCGVAARRRRAQNSTQA